MEQINKYLKITIWMNDKYNWIDELMNEGKNKWARKN